MMKFSEYLRQYMQTHNLSFTAMAKLCGIDKRQLKLYLEEDGKPRHLETLQKMAQGMCLDEEQKAGFYIAYQVTCLGKRHFYAADAVEHIVKEGIRIPDIDVRNCRETEGISRKKQEILDMLSSCANGCRQLKVIFDLRQDIQRRILYAVLQENKDCRVEQIVEFNGALNRHSIEDIVLMQNVLPMLLTGNEHIIYYRTHWNRDKKGVGTALNLLLSEKGVVLFDSGFTRGICLERPEYIAYYGNCFASVMQSCRQYGRSCGWDELAEEKDTKILWENERIIIARRKEGHVGAGAIYIWDKLGELEKGVCIEEENMARFFVEYAEKNGSILDNSRFS